MPLPLQAIAIVKSIHLLDAEDAVDAVAAGVVDVLSGGRQHRCGTRGITGVGYHLLMFYIILVDLADTVLSEVQLRCWYTDTSPT